MTTEELEEMATKAGFNQVDEWRIVGDHAHTGQAARFVELRMIGALQIVRPVFRLDSGQEVFIMDPAQICRIDTRKRRRR